MMISTTFWLRIQSQLSGAGLLCLHFRDFLVPSSTTPQEEQIQDKGAMVRYDPNLIHCCWQIPCKQGGTGLWACQDQWVVWEEKEYWSQEKECAYA
jgi:hypothetical protein